MNDVTRRNLFLCLFVVPIAVNKQPGWQEVALVQFDEHDVVRYSGIEMFFSGARYRSGPPFHLRTPEARLRYAATNWVAAQDRKDKKIAAARAARKF